MTPMITDARTGEMSKTNLPFVVCKSCFKAFDVDLEKDDSDNKRSIFGRRQKYNPKTYVHRDFEARCVFCAKINQYNSEREVWSTEGRSSDYKFGEMQYAENYELRDRMRALEGELGKVSSGKLKAEKERAKLANNIHKMQTGGASETPYKRKRSNPLSG